MPSTCILSLSCPDRACLVARVAGLIAANGGNIPDAQQFDDRLTERFFMRIEFDPAAMTVDAWRNAFSPLGAELGMDWRLRCGAAPMKVLLMVSKFDHCLGDLLYRHRIGELNMEVVGIVGNHPKTALSIPVPEDLAYRHFPVTRDTRAEQEARIRDVVTETGAELVILARYMQILSDEMASFLSGRCINIHHSFLPGFKGAKPYHQAHQRGVKMIGATAHYVTADLEEGPIIHQDVERCDHRETPEQLVAKGRDVERRVLAHAVRAHVEDRVLLNGHRTVVFD
ncbi:MULTISPECIES: formyltetrahydrofolate deformylase [Sphingobium]|uniref:formyltetrahydrofolate deformylase n=1 Tax=Sphingobium TaxID=165695 RepID=UPI00159C4300|nr:formyltetrahydrofolate deformylase [Sphingobium sp. 15-1]